MATVDDQRLTLLSATPTPRRCASPSSSTGSCESFNTIDPSHGALIERLGRLALQPKPNGPLQHGKQFAKAANCGFRKLLCGFADGTQDDTMPLIELSSMTRADAHEPYGEAVYAANNDRSPVDCGAQRQRDALHSIKLRKSNSTSTVNALNLDTDQQKLHQERPSCIYLRSCSAAAPKRVDTLAPKPSPVTTDSHGQPAPDLHDNVPYIIAQPADDFVAPLEPLGSFIKALYAIVKNPELADAESRSKKVKLHLRVTIHPDGQQHRGATPDTPQSTTSNNSNKAVAERGHRWSRSAAHAHVHPVALRYAYSPGSYRASRLRTRKCRHHVAHRKRPPATPHVGRGHLPTGHNQYAYVRHAVPQKLPDLRAPIMPSARYAAILSRILGEEQRDMLLSTQDGAWHYGRHMQPTGRDCRHSNSYGNHLVYDTLHGLPAVNRIQHVVDWLYNEENDFSASQSASDTKAEHESTRNANGHRKMREHNSTYYAQVDKTAQDLVRVMAQWELQVQH